MVRISALAFFFMVLGPQLAHAQLFTSPALVNMLKKGGYVLVMRHAQSPAEVPDARAANPDNVTRERQLDEKGRADATAMGQAMRALGIPIGQVLTSPTYRARETARLAGWDKAQSAPELGDRGQSMQGVTEKEGAWLRARAATTAPAANTIIVTHLPNITQAFGKDAADAAEGEALVFGPGPQGVPAVIGRITIGEWPGFR